MDTEQRGAQRQGVRHQRVPRNRTVTVEFEDGKELYFPEEAVPIHLKRWETVDGRRHEAINELRSFTENMDDEEDIDGIT